MEWVLGIGMLAMTGASIFGSVQQNRANQQSLELQQESLRKQEVEVEKQRKREADQIRRENEQLMNSVSRLTNTSFSGASAPALSQDKYGDLG